MPEPKMLARVGGTELSKDGALTNPLIPPTVHAGDPVARVKPGDVGVLTLVLDTANKVRPAFTLPGSPGFAYSLLGVTYGSTGADLAVGDIDSYGTDVHVKAMVDTQPSGGALSLTVDLTTGQSGIVDSADTSAPSGIDAGVGSGTGTVPIDVETAPARTDAGVGADAGTAPTAIQIGEVPSGTDAGAEVESGATPIDIETVPNGTDAGVGAETGDTPTAPSTVTFYASDVARVDNTGSVFATVRAATSGTAAENDLGNDNWFPLVNYSASVYYLYRGFLFFNTGALDDSKPIISAVLRVRYSGTVTGGPSVGVQESTVASNTDVTTDDFDAFNATELATRVSPTTNAWAEFTLNASGRAVINRTGFTKLCLREAQDIVGTYSAPKYGNIRTADDATYKPQLVVTQ